MMAKVKFENHNKIYELFIKEDLSFNQQQKTFLENVEYENVETRMVHHLYNPETCMFILSPSEIKTSKFDLI